MFNGKPPQAGEGYVTPVLQPNKVERPPTMFGLELKWISLITLSLQNAFLTIIMHYSRISQSPDKTYSAASAVLLNELLKGFISVMIALRNIDADIATSPTPAVYSDRDTRTNPSRYSLLPSMLHSSRIRTLLQSIFSPDCYKLAVPAILYVIQNNLQYVAASNLDVATFQVTYQMKILTTAFASVFILGRRLSKAKWLALILLAVGVGIVQIQTTAAPKIELKLEDLADEPVKLNERVMQPLKGFMAVTAACVTSGIAGVYFEFILKGGGGGPAPDLWIRNTQLSLFSVIPAIIPIIFFPSGPEGAQWVEKVMASFSNFNGWAIGTILTQTFGGLITAVVIRYSDNIMKGFATSISIVLSFLASVALFNYPITLPFCVGSSMVLVATYLYNAPSTARGTHVVETGTQNPQPLTSFIDQGNHSRSPTLGKPMPMPKRW